MKYFFHKTFLFVVVPLIWGAVFFPCATFSQTLQSAPRSGSALDERLNERLTERLDEDPKLVLGTLANGFSYKILPNKKPENRIMLRLVVKAGSVLEDEDQRGVAHFVEHMAFNGSAHFAENELIKYFESIGMGFGPDVNAYTSFDQTVYMLEIPADNPDALEKALTVIADWAGALTFDEEELEKERGVIIEEWRLHRGAQGRQSDALYPFLFSGSRYAKRSPIGLTEVIKNIPRQRVVDFYETWYRPELMTLIMVGDFEPTAMTRKITEKLSALETAVGASIKPKARPEYTVPLKSAKRALVFTDPELEYVVVNFGSLTQKKNVVTQNDFKQNVIENIAENIFNERLAQKVQEEGTPLLDTGVGISGILKQTVFSSVAFVPKSGLFNESFMAVLDETEKIVRFGVGASEVERQKADMLSSAKTAWQNKDKTENGALIGRLESDVLDGTPFFSIDTYYTTLQKVLGLITASEVNEAVKKYFAGRGTLLIVTAPENEKLPSKKEIVKLWKTYKAQNLHANDEDTLDERPLFPPELLAKWKQHAQSGQAAQTERVLQVTQSQSRNAPAPTITELTLANKSRVIVTPTDFKEGTFLFNAVSRGGLSLIEDENFPSASVAFDWVESSGLNGFTNTELSKKLAGKTVSLQLTASDSAVTFSGGGNTDDIETLFQLVALYFTNPDFTQAAWERIKSSIELDIANQKKRPAFCFC